MKATLLGTGGAFGVPVWNCGCEVCRLSKTSEKDRRLRPILLVETEGKRIIVDAGPDFRQQMLRYGVGALDLVLITHSHQDHVASLPELRFAGDAPVEAPADVLERLRVLRADAFEYLAARNPMLRVRAFSSRKVGGVLIDSIKVRHPKDYGIGDEPCYGYVFSAKGFKLAYIVDYDSVVEIEKLKGLDVLICDGTFMKRKVGHAGVEGAIELYRQVKPKRMVLTHMTDQNLSHDALFEYCRKFGKIEPAYDGMVIEG